MKRIPLFIFVLLAGIAPAIAAETTERTESVLDANPDCMQVNGPDCVLKSQFMPSRTVAPPGTITPSSAVVVPAPASSGTDAQGTSTMIAPAPGSTLISPRR